MPKSPEQMYKIAYNLHYTEKNLNDALIIYREIIRDFPDSPEAGYSKSQIQNIESMTPLQRERIESMRNQLAVESNIYSSNNQEIKESSISYESYQKAPVLTCILYFFGFLAIIGGIICAKIFWPDSSLLETGYIYKAVAYIPSIAWLLSGIISAFIFIALGKIIDDLGLLKYNIKYLIEQELNRIKEQK